MRPVVGGNWKCNPASAAKLPELVKNIEACDTSKCDVYVCPSPLHVSMVNFTKGAKIAPQNMNFAGCGAYTGEMAADQMVDMGIEWVLLGHSERRGEFGLPTPAESNALLATKCAYALEKGLKVVFCIGESLPIREKGIGAVTAECIKQLEQIKGLLDPAKVVIAYEPVWAIGTGVTASPEQAQETHAAIRKWISETVSPDGNATHACLITPPTEQDLLRCLIGCRSISLVTQSPRASASSTVARRTRRTRPTSRRSRTSMASSLAAPRSSPSSPRSLRPSPRPSKPEHRATDRARYGGPQVPRTSLSSRRKRMKK